MSADNETLVRVAAPHFCAGLVVVNDVCTEAAPILGWAVGMNANHLRAYFKRKGWKATIAKAPGLQPGAKPAS